MLRKKEIPKDWNTYNYANIQETRCKICSNYRGITLTSVHEQVFARVIEKN